MRRRPGGALSPTNGWDAVCAMSAKPLNSLLYQQYLREGPTRPDPAYAIRGLVIDTDSDSFYALNTVPGPPELSFAGGSGVAANLSMFLTSGTLTQFEVGDDGATVRSVVRILADRSELTGSVDLSKSHGTLNTVGAVILMLNAGSYSPTIGGVSPLVGQMLGTVVAEYFDTVQTPYLLGTILSQPEDVRAPTPPELRPTSFELCVQEAPGGAGECLLVLIATTGKPGQIGPLDTYPLASDHNAAVIVSDQILFSAILPGAMQAEFADWKTAFAGVSTPDGWKTTGNGGVMQIPEFDDHDMSISWYTADANKNESAVYIPLTSVEVAPDGGGLQLVWKQPWGQHWYTYPTDNWYLGDLLTIPMKLGVESTAVGSVREPDQVVTFHASGAPTVTVDWDISDMSSIIKYLGGGKSAVKAIAKSIQARMENLFKSLTFPDVTVFALSNLVLPSAHALDLRQVAVPGTLTVTGDVAPRVEITPARADLQPGVPQRLTASLPAGLSGGVQWITSPALGTIVTDPKDPLAAIYTPPTRVTTEQAVVITALSETDRKLDGKALVLLSPPTVAGALRIDPASVILTPGRTYSYQVRNAAGQLQQVQWKLAPSDGTIVPSIGGVYKYTAPARIDSVRDVTLTATDTKGNVATAVVTLAPTARASVSPAAVTLKPGESQQFAATIDGMPDAAITWVCLSGYGSITQTGLYTAPKQVGVGVGDTISLVAAYHVDGPVAIAVASISITVEGSAGEQDRSACPAGRQHHAKHRGSR